MHSYSGNVRLQQTLCGTEIAKHVMTLLLTYLEHSFCNVPISESSTIFLGLKGNIHGACFLSHLHSLTDHPSRHKITDFENEMSPNRYLEDKGHKSGRRYPVIWVNSLYFSFSLVCGLDILIPCYIIALSSTPKLGSSVELMFILLTLINTINY